MERARHPAEGGSAFHDRLAEAIDAAGTPAFGDRLLAALAERANVDHLTVLFAAPGGALTTLAMASRRDLGEVRSLTRDYIATEHRLDPNHPELVRPGRTRRVLALRHDPAQLASRAYQQRFYTTVGIVDKIAFLWRAHHGGYYVNLYRTNASGPYAPAEARRLEALAALTASLVRLHDGRGAVVAALAGGATGDLVARLVALMDERLSRREREVLERTLIGMGTEGIALDLGLKPASIVTFRKRAYAKLGISSQAELFARCLAVLPKAAAGAPAA